jgi:hypothetical protein
LVDESKTSGALLLLLLLLLRRQRPPRKASASTSEGLSHARRACGTQSNFGAMDSIAAHFDGYSPRCSRRML